MIDKNVVQNKISKISFIESTPILDEEIDDKIINESKDSI